MPQKRLFQRIARQSPLSPGALAREVAEVLKCGRSAAYDRMAGRTNLSIGELERLGRHYGVYLKDVMLDVNQHTVSENPLEEMGRALAQAARTRSMIYFATTEIPVFYLFQYPELAAVKTFIWKTFNWRAEGKTIPTFDLKWWQRESEVRQLRNLWELYRRAPTREIWCSVMLDNFLNQIQYLGQSGYLESHTDLDALEDALRALVADLRTYVVTARKQDHAELSVRDNEFSTTNNFVLVEEPGRTVAYLTGIAMTIFRNEDPLLTRQLQRSWHQQVQHSQPLTHGSERDRHSFFTKLNERTNLAMERTRSFLRPN